jgi:hypothetical protein
MKALLVVSGLGAILLGVLVARASGTRQVIAGRTYRWTGSITPPLSAQGVELMTQTLGTTGAKEIAIRQAGGATEVEFTMKSTTDRHVELGKPILSLPAPNGVPVEVVLTAVKEL